MYQSQVRSITGETYMLNQDEELWKKELPPAVETLLVSARDPLADRSDRSSSSSTPKARDKTKVITFRVPHNAAVQIYDYKEKKARWVVVGLSICLSVWVCVCWVICVVIWENPLHVVQGNFAEINKIIFKIVMFYFISINFNNT